MREFCRIKLANTQVKIQEPVTRDSEDLQHQVQVKRHSNNLFCPYSVDQGTN